MVKLSPSTLLFIMSMLSPSFAFMNVCRSTAISIKSLMARHANHSRLRNFHSSKIITIINSCNDDIGRGERNSVTGTIYTVGDESTTSHPTVQLYTKEGCTLCDKAKDVLQLLREEQPHSLEAIDITDPDKTEYFDKYKWDIPVLHINGLYWTKHRLTADEARKSLEDARSGIFEAQRGEPNAAAMEKKMADRKAKS